jgi:mannose-6-phosphate isomerase-like protein (cupin superfamily)
MIVRGSELAEENGRKPYPIAHGATEGWGEPGWHFVIRTTTPENPFGPHKHDGTEMWFILEGEALLTLDGEVYPVAAGDLIQLAPWSEHGLHTETQVRWVCMG